MFNTIREKIKIWGENKDMPILAPMKEGNVVVITAYLNQGDVTVTYKGQIKTGKFTDNSLRKIIKGADIERRKAAIEKFCGAIAQLLFQIEN